MRTPMDILNKAASAAPDAKLIFYQDETALNAQIAMGFDAEEDNNPNISYLELHSLANNNSELIRQYLNKSGAAVLLHLDTHAQYITWFWSTIAAGAVPVISTALTTDITARDRHLQHLRDMLGSPLIITTRSLRHELGPLSDMDFLIIEDSPESSKSSFGNNRNDGNGRREHADDIAFMMLTSGSTGSAKAVEITHAQLDAAIIGKQRMLRTSEDDVFLNWIGFDHVACVTEIHIHAMAACATQIHLDPRLSLRNPLLWLRLLGIQKVSITFAPNFFLAAAIKALETRTERLDIDLSNLRLVISGGEANRVSTGIAFNNAVKTLGTNRNVLCPAFGMTETCAGSIYNLEFPELEIRNRLEFCSVGTSTISLRYLITNDNGLACATGQAGDLQLKGPAIFKNYHNNSGATEAAFTKYGYLKTGDTGYMDADGNLVLVGRTKDSIIINGVKYFSSDLEAVVEEAASEYLVPSYTTVFPIRSEGDDTEDVVVTFVASSTIPSDPMHVDPQDTSCDATLYDALEKIASTIFLHCSKKPRNIIPLPRDYLQRTSLGKLSRSAIKLAFEDGRFRNNDEDTRYRISRHRATTRRVPVSDMEKELAKVFASEFDLDIGEVGVDTSLVDMGLDSIRLLRLKGHLQQQLGLNDVRIGTLLANPTIEKLANALSINNVVKEYDPVIVLQSGKSTAAPVWFIHPGLGEVLVFLNISNYFAGRRVFAVRAPGFNAGEKMFKSIDEMTNVYVEAIRCHQPDGPYILIGYSFGSMIAFETTKKLEIAGQKVFMGSLNGPPHIKWRMVEIDWCELFLNLSYFLGFLPEEDAIMRSTKFRLAGFTKDEIVSMIMAIASPAKLADLDLNAEKLKHWADVSSQLQALARDYDPEGKVQHIDVFYANPLVAIGRDKHEWLENHLHDWNHFCQEPVQFHDSPGAHYTMLDPDHVFEMQKVMRAALRARGVL